METMQEQVVGAYRDRFGGAPEVVTRAPGRLEILGNHTDYNEGLVISCAVDRGTWFAGGRCDGPAVVRSADLETEATFDPADVGDPVPGDWANYVKGVVRELAARRAAVAPFQAVVASDLPMSCGMSSSAALEVAVAYGLGGLNNLEFEPSEWARIGQGAENNFVGARTGLLDQFSSIMGRENHLVLSDFRTLEVERVPFDGRFVFVIANSGVKHDLTQEYNERRTSCEEAAAILAARYPGVTALRDVASEQLDASREELPLIAYRRARHIVGENERVTAGVALLEKGDLPGFGALLTQSHQSSVDNFENSCPELDILVATGTSLPTGLGARLSGGGFGGISVHLVRRDDAEEYRRQLETAFHSRTGRVPQTMVCGIGAGADRHV